jgi:hypothetical protein
LFERHESIISDIFENGIDDSDPFSKIGNPFPLDSL